MNRKRRKQAEKKIRRDRKEERRFQRILAMIDRGMTAVFGEPKVKWCSTGESNPEPPHSECGASANWAS